MSDRTIKVDIIVSTERFARAVAKFNPGALSAAGLFMPRARSMIAAAQRASAEYAAHEREINALLAFTGRQPLTWVGIRPRRIDAARRRRMATQMRHTQRRAARRANR